MNEDFFHITPGADGAIKNIFEVFLDPKDLVLMQDPCWPMYWVYSNVYQAEILKLQFEDDLNFNAENFIDLINTKKPRITIIANPNMPTGTLINQETLEKIIEATKQVSSLLVVDEAYFLFCKFTAINYIKENEHMIIVRTFSKAFGLAGLRLGYCVACPDIIKNLFLTRPIADANNIALKTQALP